MGLPEEGVERIRMKKFINSEYIYYTSYGNIFRKQVDKKAKISNQTSISKGDIDSINIIISR